MLFRILKFEVEMCSFYLSLKFNNNRLNMIDFIQS